MWKSVAVAGLALSASACATLTPPGYRVAVDNNFTLKAYTGAAVKVASITATGEYDMSCRLAGKIQPANGMSIPQYVEKAFNDELKMANIYSNGGITLTGSLTRVDFDSMVGLTNGIWRMALTMSSSNGKSMNVESNYEFASDLRGTPACDKTTMAFAPAVEGLIRKVVTDARFVTLVR